MRRALGSLPRTGQRSIGKIKLDIGIQMFQFSERLPPRYGQQRRWWFPFLPSSFYALLITTESTFRLFPGYILLRQQHPQQLFFSSSFPFLSRHVSRIYLSYSRILYIYSWTHSFTHSRAHRPDVNSTPSSSSSSFPILSQINHNHRYHY